MRYASVLWVSLIAGCVAGDPRNMIVDVNDGGPRSALGKADELFSQRPFFLTGAFDGSRSFWMWVDTMRFARQIEGEFQQPLHFSYFINTAYYDHTVRGSVIGRSRGEDEQVVRWALTQQAINEGHEIGSHAVRHLDGSSWTVEQWRSELREFDELVKRNLFRPIPDPEAGGFVFPRWRPTSDQPGTVGASCQTNADCSSGICLPVSREQSFCSQECDSACPNRTVCGMPNDVCVPMPEFPIRYQGQILFDANGRPNLQHPSLTVYPVIGFRAPQLGHNAALYEVLTEQGYRYDTSQVRTRSPGPPARTSYAGRTYDAIFQFPLIKNPGSLTVPMDFGYHIRQASKDRMLGDYRQSVLDAYNQRHRQPWNIGHHFSLWDGGIWWEAMQETFRFAAQGCPADNGALRCEQTAFPSFAELATILGHIDGGADFAGDDLFLDLAEDGDELPFDPSGACHD